MTFDAERKTADDYGLPPDHDCERDGCVYSAHYDESGFCAVCGGCGDPACCVHDDDCFIDVLFERGLPLIR